MKRLLWVLFAAVALSLVAATNPPRVTTEPRSATVLVSQPAAFSVAAVGEDLAYQWQKDGVDISGATLPVFIIPQVQLADDQSQFQVRVTNDQGSVVSCMAVLTVITSGTPSTGPPICPDEQTAGGGGRGCGGGGGGRRSEEGSSSTTSDGGPYDSGDWELPDFLQPYPVTRWKGTVKATTVLMSANENLTTVVEGDVTFESPPHAVGLHPSSISSVEGSLTVSRTGMAAGCVDTVSASGTIGPGEGTIAFQADPPLPQYPTQLEYNGLGGSFVEGTQTRSCPSTIEQPWSDLSYWLMTGSDLTTSPDLSVISGTYVLAVPPYSTTTYEWTLVKQP